MFVPKSTRILSSLPLPSTSKACYACMEAMAAISAGFNPKSPRRAGFSTSAIASRRDSFRWRGPRDDEMRNIRAIKRELGRLSFLDGEKPSFRTKGESEGLPDYGKERQESHPTGFREEPPDRPHWQLHREALKEKFPEGWNPPRKISRSEMNTIRRLHNMDPEQFSTPALADQFKISAEAVRRILRSKFRTDEEVEEEKVGDALLQEVELGEYASSSSYAARNNSRTRCTARRQDVEVDRPERTEPTATPLQEGFDMTKSPARSKWVARKRREEPDSHSSSILGSRV